MPTIILLNGPMGAGKSTLCKRLDEALDDYLFIDRAEIKNGMLKKLEDRELAKTLSKKVCFDILRAVMPLRQNIILQEFKTESLRKHLGKELEEHGYRIRSFFLQISLEASQRRDLQRQDKYKRYLVVSKVHEDSKPGPEDIIIDTEACDIDGALAQILAHAGGPGSKTA